MHLTLFASTGIEKHIEDQRAYGEPTSTDYKVSISLSIYYSITLLFYPSNYLSIYRLWMIFLIVID
jgi:hypothetical protein